ncbi:MAG: BolA family protein [Gammaproteobacteria bacterium]
MSDDTRKALQRSRLDAVGQRLTQTLEASQLDIKDVTHRHRRHAEAQDGRAHFEVRVVSAKFMGQRTLARHRAVYDALDDLMKTDIHALSITALTPDEDSELSPSTLNS